MSTFTVTFSEFFEDFDATTVDDAVNLSGLIGLDTYPVPEASYRDVLNKKIIRRFWDREIAHGTMDKFAMRIETVLLEEMPYYNELYLTTQMQFDPMMTMDLKTVATGEQTSSQQGTNLATNTEESHARSVNSMTPQNQLSGNGDYADSMADSNSDGRNTSNATTTGEGEVTNNTTSQTTGYQGIPSELLRRYRDTIINVDMMILNRLESLFMSITSSGSEYFFTESPYYLQYFPGRYYI